MGSNPAERASKAERRLEKIREFEEEGFASKASTYRGRARNSAELAMYELHTFVEGWGTIAKRRGRSDSPGELDKVFSSPMGPAWAVELARDLLGHAGAPAKKKSARMLLDDLGREDRGTLGVELLADSLPDMVERLQNSYYSMSEKKFVERNQEQLIAVVDAGLKALESQGVIQKREALQVLEGVGQVQDRGEGLESLYDFEDGDVAAAAR